MTDPWPRSRTACNATGRPPGRAATRRRLAFGLALASAVGSCGPRSAPAPTAASSASRPAPDLRGRPVMLLPAQRVTDVPGDPDAELAYAVEARPGGAAWVLPDALAEALRANPGLDARLHDLPVGVFLRSEVRRVGDPLFGLLRRLAALTDAEVAVVPVAVRYRPSVTSEATAGAVEIAAAVLAVRTGRVLWYGVVAGDPGAAAAPGSLASAVDALVKRLLPEA